MEEGVAFGLTSNTLDAKHLASVWQRSAWSELAIVVWWNNLQYTPRHHVGAADREAESMSIAAFDAAAPSIGLDPM